MLGGFNKRLKFDRQVGAVEWKQITLFLVSLIDMKIYFTYIFNKVIDKHNCQVKLGKQSNCIDTLFYINHMFSKYLLFSSRTLVKKNNQANKM